MKRHAAIILFTLNACDIPARQAEDLAPNDWISTARLSVRLSDWTVSGVAQHSDASALASWAHTLAAKKKPFAPSP